MSKFIERLKQLSEGAPQPIGFRARAAAEKLKIQLVAAVGDVGIGEQAAGADTFLVYGEVERAPKTEAPWGASVGSGPVPDGCDFVVFPGETPLAIGVKEGVGKVMTVNPSLAGDVVRAINGVSLDAALLLAAEPGKESLTWSDLVEIHRFAAILGKPLLVEAPSTITGPEMQQVWQAGAAGIVVRIVAGQTGRLQELRAAISKLTPPVPPRADRPAARAPMAPVPHPEEDEEDDED